VVAAFAATVNATVPCPLPLMPLDTLSHDGTLSTCHEHPFVVVTLTDPEPPLLPNDAEAGATA